MQVCQAKYSDVPVWVLNSNGVGVMRRQVDGWVNATHLLKVANFDKARRTRILERDVQSGIHEKVQGGYGKYQGTWVPLERGRALAEEFGVAEAVCALLDYEPKENEELPAPPAARKSASVSKPPAPKRARKAATAPAAPKASKRPSVSATPTPKTALTVASEKKESSPSSSEEETPPLHQVQQQGHSYMDQYSAALLDLFMSPTKDKIPEMLLNPRPGYHINQAIDDEGHTVFHWASAMGQVKVMEALIEAGARVDAVNNAGQTPLVRAIQFTNNYDLRLFPHVLELLKSTILNLDNEDRNILHHIAATTSSKSRGSSARYYLETILSKVAELEGMSLCSQIINARDNNGDTPLHIAARNSSRKLVKVFLSYNAPTDVHNRAGRTAQEYIYEYEVQRQPLNSSSPVAPGSPHPPYMRHAGPSMPLARHQPNQHISEAAITATRQVPGIVADYLEDLAQVYDGSLRDKESDIEQVRSLLMQVNKNTVEIQHEIPDLVAQLGPEDELNSKMQSATAQVHQKSDRLRKIVERSQARDLALLVQEKESKIHEDIEQQLKYPDHKKSAQLWQILADMQRQRRELVDEIVGLYSTASSGDRINKYRKLVSMSGGVDINNVDDLLDGFIEALEDKS